MNNHEIFSFSDKQSKAFLIGLIVIFFLGFLAPRTLAFLPPLMGLGFLITAALQRKFLLPKTEELTLFATTLLLALLSSLWAPDQAFAIERTIKTAAILIPGLFLISAARHIIWPKTIPLIPILIGLHFIIAVFFIHEKMTDHQVYAFILNKEINSFKLNRSFVVYILFTLPLLFMIKTAAIDRTRKIIAFLFVTAVATVAVQYTESQTTQLTFIIGLLFLLAFPIKWKKSIKVFAAGVLLLTLLMPFAMKPLQNTLPEDVLLSGVLRQASIVHRLEVWNYAADKALASPIYGNGIEALRFMKADQWMEHQKSYNALHAHNVVLQIWAEFGLIGILLGMVFLIYLFKKTEEEDLETKKLYITVFAICFSVSLTGYGFWQGWQLGLFILMAAFAITLSRRQKTL